jgi:hypothetical protein
MLESSFVDALTEVLGEDEPQAGSNDGFGAW